MPIPERSFIKAVQRAASRAGKPAGVVAGIGDDCAVLRVGSGNEILVTTDFSLEGIHFRREWHSPEAVGHRCLARGLSDIAAMSGIPVAAFLSLAMPANLPQRWVDGFLHGFLRLADRYCVPLAGGDTGESPTGVLADIVLIGRVPKGTALLRSAAKPGDSIYVTGELGTSAAILAKLQRGARKTGLGNAHFFPEPRLAVGTFLRERRMASAAIDLSDGLSTDLAHVCEESGVGAAIQASAIPHAKEVTLEQALHGGEDYELLFTAPPKTKVPLRIAGVRVSRIGEVTRDREMYLADETGRRVRLTAAGWEHFVP